MSYVRVGIYTLKGDAQKVIDEINSSALPMYQKESGFVSYSVAMTDDNTIISSSVWETKEAADKAREMMQDWASETVASEVSFKEDFVGEVVIQG